MGRAKGTTGGASVEPLVRSGPRPDPSAEVTGVIEKPSDPVIERAKARDHEALVTFFGRHERGLFAYFSGPMHWHWSFVPDLVQETMTRAIKSFPSFRGSTNTQAERWLFGIARNVHMQEVSRQVGIRLRRDVAAELAPYQQRHCDATWYRSGHVDALQQLPLGQLEVLRLMLEGLTIREIAAELGLPEGTVATRIHRARHRLRLTLDDDAGIDDPDTEDRGPETRRGS
ncbi:MAG: sigma-70 family RNA polymerase sigma factor [Polyangiaceae bacterium]